MDAALLARLSAELDRLIDADPAEQRAAVARLSETDPVLARALERALAAACSEWPLIDNGLSVLFPADEEPPADSLEAGTRIGAWRLVRELGRGGMGRVWLAERDDAEYRFEVAIKLLEGVPGSGLLRTQFLRERQILADLDHPSIARLVDGGVHENGTLWYAMEYVRGAPLNLWCQARKLGIGERLALLARIARVVHHAHTRLVVHRDLKPANILIDEAGEPHLLDFGIAKLLEAEPAPGAGPLTLLAASTPEYAAPEQRQGRPVGTTADVYALGVIAHELLAESRPPAGSGDARTGHLPSSSPGLDRRLRVRLRGDIDAIVACALATDPGYRYGSAEAFAEDIERHLDGLPVRARPAGAAYRIGKFVRRHHLAAGLGLAAVAALCIALVVSIVHTARTERALARAEAVQAFLLNVFDAVEPGPGDTGILTQRELADRAAAQLDRALVAQPDTRVDLLIALAQVFRKLGFAERARPLLAGALATLDDETAPASDPRRIEALYALGRADYYADEFGASVRHLTEADRLAAAAGLPPGRRAGILFELGAGQSRLLMLEDALDSLDRAEAMARRSPQGQPLLPRILLLKALTHRRDGRLDQAIGSGEEALEAARREYGALHVRTAAALSTVGAMQRRAGRLDAAEAMLREALEIELEAYGQAQPATLSNLGAVLLDQGRLDESGRRFQEALDRAEARYGAGSASAASYRRNLAMQQWLAGEAEVAAAALEQAYARYAAEHPPASSYNLNMRVQLAAVLAAAGRRDEAAQLLPAIFERGTEAPSSITGVVRRAHGVAAQIALAAGQLEAAHEHIEAALVGLDAAELETAVRTRLGLVAGDIALAAADAEAARRHWSAALEVAGRLGEAHPYRLALIERLDKLGPGRPNTAATGFNALRNGH